MIKLFFDRLYHNFFNESLKEKFELFTLYAAGIGFLVHLAVVFLTIANLIQLPLDDRGFLSNPIAAVYTPFSVILFYEIYLLVYYLPRSFSISIAKQYEIVSLILIRRIFKDISHLDINGFDLFTTQNLGLLYDVLGFVALFFLIYLFRYLLVQKRSHTVTANIEGFIRFKKILCIMLVPVFLFLSLYSFLDWAIELNQFYNGQTTTVRDINKVFYNEFFVALIIVDVLILIGSFRYTDRYSLLIRNTGFVISTVLIRVSFSADGLANILLLISGVGFGVIILYLYSLYDKIDKGESTKESYAYL